MIEGTPYQEGYKAGLRVARGESEPFKGGDAVGMPSSYYDWWSGYRHALTSEAVRLRGTKTIAQVTK